MNDNAVEWADLRPEMPDMLVTAQVAEMLFMSESHVRRLAARGDLPSVKYGHRLRLFRRSDVEAWFRDHITVEPCNGSADPT